MFALFVGIEALLCGRRFPACAGIAKLRRECSTGDQGKSQALKET
jgi:hypothetical protein